MNKENWNSIFPDEELRGEVRFNEPMMKYTSFRVGGPAEVMFFPKDLSDLKILLSGARKNNIPVFILGMGTNLLVRDGGIPGITVNLKNFNRIKRERGGVIYVEAGVPLPRLLTFTARHGLEGLEFAAGIPGTLGGAIMMNAGTKEGEMKDVVDSVTLINRNGDVKVVKREEIPFGYRRSGIEGMIVVNANLKLRKGEKEIIKKRIRDLLKERMNREPSGLPNAGSVFKNPESPESSSGSGLSAGRVIEELGLKGFRVGDAEVSQVHANFIVNRGKAKASDIISLMKVIKEKVFEERRIVLEPEIRIVGINGNR